MAREEAVREHMVLAEGLVEALSKLFAGAQQLLQEQPGGVTRSQLAPLRYLAEHGTTTMFTLAKGVGVTGPTMTSAVKLLVRKGLVERRHDDQDWRNVLITITPAGLAAQEQAVQVRTAAVATTIAELSPEQRAMLMISLPAIQMLARKIAERAGTAPHERDSEVEGQ